jgi:hypothetical protein
MYVATVGFTSAPSDVMVGGVLTDSRAVTTL